MDYFFLYPTQEYKKFVFPEDQITEFPLETSDELIIFGQIVDSSKVQVTTP